MLSNTRNKEEEILEQDKIEKFLAYHGKVSVVIARTTHLLQQVRDKQDLSPTASAALGRVLTMTAMMGSRLKGEKDKITIQIRGNGPIGSIVAVGNAKSEVKGYVGNPLVDLPIREDGKLDVGMAVGRQGFLYVIKDLGLKEPYQGMVPIISGEIAEDFTHYFATSEQTPCAIALGVLVDKKGIKVAGGYMVSPMPDAPEEVIDQLEEQLQKVGQVSNLLESNTSLLEVAKQVTGDEEVQMLPEQVQPNFVCECNKEKIEKMLLSLGKKELQEMLEQEKETEIACHFCGSKYKITKEELRNLMNNAEEKKNP